ncbi:MAG: hypothetical protein IJ960_00740 [Oscillospiraceae bacterium]|nr:hypothetical protein [Oscillospiraceae bacterium]
MSYAQSCAFPEVKEEALAMLYVQNQDLTGKTPEEIADIYEEAYQKIVRHYNAKRDAQKVWL